MFDPLPRIARRVALRRLRRADLPAFQAYRHDEEVGRYQSWVPQTDDEANAFLERMSRAPLFPAGDWVQLAIADLRADELIGDIGLCVAADLASAEIGFTLRSQSQGRGLATEAVREAIQLAFEHTEISRVVAITDARNWASIRLLERVGMRRIASRNATFRGEECIEHEYVVTRQDGG